MIRYILWGVPLNVDGVLPESPLDPIRHWYYCIAITVNGCDYTAEHLLTPAQYAQEPREHWDIRMHRWLVGLLMRELRTALFHSLPGYEK